MLKSIGILVWLLFQILFLLPQIISLLHGVHKFLDIHIERKPPINTESVEEVWPKIPPVPGNDSTGFFSFFCAEVQFIACLAFQEDDARDCYVAIG